MSSYALTGPASQRAVAQGLANAEWFTPNVDRERLAELQVRTNGRAAADVVVWLGLIVASGLWAYSTVWSWWSIPAFAAYGAVACGAADARWHECGHGTAFRSARLNDVVYYFASFLLWRGPTVWRWSHYRHHTDTIIVGRDAEIVYQRPANVWRAVLAFTHLEGGTKMFLRLVRHAVGRIDPDAAELVPSSEHRKVVWESRFIVGIVMAFAVWSVAAWSIVPLMFVGFATIYGGWLVVFFGITQHAGMRENVLDHRYSTRTVLMNPVFRFLYLNMNYHVEHHMLPSVPYRSLPALHAEIRDQLAPAKPHTLAAYREIFDALRRQGPDPTWEIPLDVPEVPSAEQRRIDVGETNWVRHADGSVDLGAADTLAAGQMRRADVGDHTFVVCRLSDGSLALADGLCTHAAVHLADGALVDGHIECPKHNGRFDARTGCPTRKPVVRALQTYDISEMDGRIVSQLAITWHDRPRTEGVNDE